MLCDSATWREVLKRVQHDKNEGKIMEVVGLRCLQHDKFEGIC